MAIEDNGAQAVMFERERSERTGQSWSKLAVASAACAVTAIVLIISLWWVETATHTGESGPILLLVPFLMLAAVFLGMGGLVQTTERRRQKGRTFAIIGLVLAALMLAGIVFLIWAASQIEF